MASDRQEARSAAQDRIKPDAATEIRWLRDALERSDHAIRALLNGKSVRDADEILASNAWLLFAEPETNDHA